MNMNRIKNIFIHTSITTTVFFLIFFFIQFDNKALASTILFRDDFESGSDINWTRVSGENLWQVKNVNGSMRYGAVIESRNTIINTVAGESSWTDYILEMDMLPISGIDKNISFRWTNERGFCNQFHLNPNIHMDYTDPGIIYEMQNNTIYHIKVILIGERYQLYIDDNKLVDIEIKNQEPPCLNGSIVLTISTGTTPPTEVWFDNIIVKKISDNINLNVPYLSQTDPDWKNETHNNSKKWSNDKTTIESWGCALTSATMILNYYNINKMPNGDSLTPKSVNKWLKNQPDGYIGNGWINWLAISRLSKIAKNSGNNPNFEFNCLEFSKNIGNNISVLKNDLEKLHPDILEVPGHFIVAKGTQDDTFLIHDPYYKNRSTLKEHYGNEFKTLSRYLPTNSDLSYLMIITDKNIKTQVSDNEENNHTITTHLQESMHEKMNKNSTNNNPLIFNYLQIPPSGEYKIKFSSSNTGYYPIKIYAYDKNGNVKIINENTIINTNEIAKYKFSYNKDHINKSKIIKEVSLISIINDIDYLYKNNNIKNNRFKNLLLKIVNDANKINNENHKKRYNTKLNELKLIILVSKNIFIDNIGFNILNQDIKYLLK